MVPGQFRAQSASCSQSGSSKVPSPDEGVWQCLKQVELRNDCCPTLRELDREVRLAARGLRRKPRVVRACFAQAGCL